MIKKVRSEDNLADPLAKYVSGAEVAQMLQRLGINIEEGRHVLTPEE